MGSACCGSKSSVILPKPKNDPHRIKSPPMSRENSVMQRFNKVRFSKTDPLILIDGYSNEPLVSLEEALKPFDGKIDQLSHYIKEAKAKCYRSSKHKLTHDESAAIYIYTMKWGPQSLYDRLQKAWDSENRSQLKPWFSYLKLFKSALDKLPNAKKKVWQGTSFNKGINDQLTSKSTSMYSCMCSCSPLANNIEEHLKKHPDAKIIMVSYESVDGKDVTGYTAASKSKEVLIWPGTQLNVAKYTVVDDKGSLTVHLVGVSDHPPKSVEFDAPTSDKHISGKHFVCPHTGCGNRCPDDHDAHHCHGFASLSHTCQHHCGPDYTCNNCKKHVGNLRECYNCHRRSCDKCCLQ